MNNKDFEEEKKHLKDTIKGIEDSSYYIYERLEKKKVLFKQRENFTGDGITYQRDKRDYEILKKVMDQPYIGRIDVYSEDDGENTYYIGEHGIRNKDDDIIVVDWRMPISSVFYNFTPGNATQEYVITDNNNRKIKNVVNVTRKRNYVIKNRELINMIQQVADPNSKFNITQGEQGEELSINDEFLKDIIENSESNGYLKKIIASIQQEQDKAIRQPINKNVIIQGVAGSGKSSIALHRISFLLFNNKNLNPEDILILGPTNLFISSFKGLLPDLDLEGIHQSTFKEIVFDFMKNDLKGINIETSKYYFEEILFKKSSQEERERIAFKGSDTFALLLDIFVEEMKKQYEERMKGISLLDHFMDKEELLKIFHGYNYLSFSKKVERFLSHVENIYKDLLTEKCNEVKTQREFIENKYLRGGGLEQHEYNTLLQGMEKIYKYKVSKLEEEFKTKIIAWKKNMQILDPLSIYKQVLSYDILSSFEYEIGEDIPQLFTSPIDNKLTEFDLPPILYIYTLLNDIPRNYAHIVIDEAQDLSFMHFAVLKKLTKTMTILGDLDQSIYIGYGQEDWDLLLKSITPNNEDLILELETSYRSTKEIINTANRVLTNQFGMFHKQITPLNRSGKTVQFEQIQTGRDLLEQIKSTIADWKKHYKRIAIIHKDEHKAISLAKVLKEDFNEDAGYISPNQDVQKESISVLTSYYSKGMEFDAVILVNINEDNFPKDDLHARLLYVLLTRAQQEVKVFYQDSPSQLLEGLFEKQPKIITKYDSIL